MLGHSEWGEQGRGVPILKEVWPSCPLQRCLACGACRWEVGVTPSCSDSHMGRGWGCEMCCWEMLACGIAR